MMRVCVCVPSRSDKQLPPRLKLSLTSIECLPSADIRGALCEMMLQVEVQTLTGAKTSAGMDFRWAQSCGAG